MLAREARVLADVVDIQVDSSFPCIKLRMDKSTILRVQNNEVLTTSDYREYK